MEKHPKNKRQKVDEDSEVRIGGETVESSESEEEEGSSSEEDMGYQALHPEIPKTYLEKDSWVRLIVILEQANLETTRTKRTIELINCDDHQKVITKLGKKFEDYRPDVTH